MKNNKLRKFLSATGSIASIAVIAALLLLTVYPAAAKLFFGIKHPTVLGFSTAVVISGSMAEEINVNDVVIIHRQEGYEKGDVISFHSCSGLVTHRIAEEIDEGFITKGDANNTPDPDIVTYNSIEGKVVLIIPKIGGAIQFFSTPLGMLILFTIAVILLFIPAKTKDSSDGGGKGGEEK
ncbi:MAG: signal peptidase I [Ruminococcus sp.]|nr:signal peptidase I [Ruminococcus sp.]